MDERFEVKRLLNVLSCRPRPSDFVKSGQEGARHRISGARKPAGRGIIRSAPAQTPRRARLFKRGGSKSEGDAGTLQQQAVIPLRVGDVELRVLRLNGRFQRVALRRRT